MKLPGAIIYFSFFRPLIISLTACLMFIVWINQISNYYNLIVMFTDTLYILQSDQWNVIFLKTRHQIKLYPICPALFFFSFFFALH